MLEQILLYVKSLTPIAWIAIGLVVIIILLIVANRGNKVFAELVDQAVISAEQSFKSGEGKQKLEFAKQFIKMNIKQVPFLSRLLIGTWLTEANVIKLIEASLTKLSKLFGSGINVKIKSEDKK